MSRIAIEMGRSYFYDQITMRGRIERVNSLNPDFIISQSSSLEAVEQIKGNYKGFHVIRDPRDIWISSYYSYKKTHEIGEWKNLGKLREKLEGMDFEEGMMQLLEFNSEFFDQMEYWNYKDQNILEIRYEDFIQDPKTRIMEIMKFLGLIEEKGKGFSTFKANLNRLTHSTGFLKNIRFYQRSISPQRLQSLSEELSFSNLSKGRKKGQEDRSSHYRKGVSGDWKNALTPALKKAFNDAHPGLLMNLGYEKDELWLID